MIPDEFLRDGNSAIGVSALVRMMWPQEYDKMNSAGISSMSGMGSMGGMRGMGKPPSAADLLSKMDSNQDGTISSDEAQGPLKDRFQTADSNSDGKVTLDELQKDMDSFQQEMQAKQGSSSASSSDTLLAAVAKALGTNNLAEVVQRMKMAVQAYNSQNSSSQTASVLSTAA
ncbi:MAG: hypothetical protein HQM06_04340 [Magnetococcales bacterium]|nr:hypothetical protein [Magnetococcales bacterium]